MTLKPSHFLKLVFKVEKTEIFAIFLLTMNCFHQIGVPPMNMCNINKNSYENTISKSIKIARKREVYHYLIEGIIYGAENTSFLEQPSHLSSIGASFLEQVPHFLQNHTWAHHFLSRCLMKKFGHLLKKWCTCSRNDTLAQVMMCPGIIRTCSWSSDLTTVKLTIIERN